MAAALCSLRSRLALWAPLLTAVLLSACQPAPSGASFFPLEAGHRWTYRVTTTLEDDSSPERETLTLRAYGSEKLAELGEQAAWRRHSDSGIDYWLRTDETGIYRVASQSVLDEHVQSDTARRYVLKTPLQPGTQWQAYTTAYLLLRSNEFPREIRHAHPKIPMNYQIMESNLTVDSPAGQFKNCLRVQGLATLRLYADPATGWRDLPLTTQEWYCAGIGLVRMERQEPAHSAFLTGGTRTLELESWE